MWGQAYRLSSPSQTSPSSGARLGRGGKVKGTSLEPWIQPLAPGHLRYRKSFLGLREDKRASRNIKYPEGLRLAPCFFGRPRTWQFPSGY